MSVKDVKKEQEP